MLTWPTCAHTIQVSTGELAEVMAINAIAPTILNGRLKPLLQASPARFKFIVNVSAMEGKFYRWKSENHPHTNMAKAALNMMTRTSAQDYIRSGIYMTAVDTGWINDEKPMEKAVAHEDTHNFQTPLDEIDAAARVLDPVIAPLLAASKGEDVTPPYGIFLKDFVKCEW
jgi:NAD(P)-dependent dehydrogenase (short-subunit alcohol dehydrogenase family)